MIPRGLIAPMVESAIRWLTRGPDWRLVTLIVRLLRFARYLLRL